MKSKWLRYLSVFVFAVFLLGTVIPDIPVFAKGGSSFSGGGGRSSSSSSSSSVFSSSRSSSGSSSSGFSSSKPSSSPSSSGFSSGNKSSDASPKSSGGFSNSSGASAGDKSPTKTSAFSSEGSKAIDKRDTPTATSSSGSKPSSSGGWFSSSKPSNQTTVINRTYVYRERPTYWAPSYYSYPMGYSPTAQTLNFLYQLELIRAMQNVNERNIAMAQLRNDPSYAQHRAEVDKIAQENAELKAQLASVDNAKFDETSAPIPKKSSSHWFLWLLVICAISGTIYWFVRRK